MKLKPNILMLLVFLAVVLSPYLIAYFNGQEITGFDWFTMTFLVLFAFMVFVWWKRKNRSNPDLIDNLSEHKRPTSQKSDKDDDDFGEGIIGTIIDFLD